MSEAWHALRTAPSKELVGKAVMERAGHECHVPTELKRRRLSRHQKARETTPIEYPVFPGYAFIRRQAHMNWHSILTAPVISGVLRQDDQPAAIPAEQLARFAAPTEAPLNRHAHIRAGCVFRITQGPFEGYAGKLKSVNGDEGVMGVSLLGTSTDYRISLDALQPVE